MSVGTVQPIAIGADLEVWRHGGFPFVEQATQTFFEGGLLVRDTNGLVGECGANFTRVDAIALIPGHNAASSGQIASALPISPSYIFEFTLIQAWHQNLAKAGTYYGLTSTSFTANDGTTQNAWCIDTANTSPHVEILGLAGPSDLTPAGGWADGDTNIRVIGRFNPAIVGIVGSSNLLGVANTLTAHSGGGQTSALALTAAYNRVTTVAALGDSVRLPASAAGLAVTIDNQGANPLRVFGAGTDTINAITTTVGVSQGVGVIATYFCTVAGNWEISVAGGTRASRVAITADGAVDPHTAAEYIVTKAGVAAMTLAAPTTGAPDDGIRIAIISNTTNAHTLTATGLFGSGSSAVNLATFAAFLGAGLILEAKSGKWLVVSSNGITFS